MKPMKSKKPVKRRPKIKRVTIPAAAVLHVNVPAKMIPVIVPGPDPHVMKVIPIPADKPQSWMDFFFGVEKK